VWIAGAAVATAASASIVLDEEEDEMIQAAVAPFSGGVTACDEVEEQAILVGFLDELKKKGSALSNTVMKGGGGDSSISGKKLGVKHKYRVYWRKPLGRGAEGIVYRAIERKTGDAVAIKKVAKAMTDDDGFLREFGSMMHIREAGGHPNICSLREDFVEGEDYYLVLELISGGEMFDHLVRRGAYSEADAARLIRELASALAYLHGIGLVHGDMKPENVMLSTSNRSDSVVKLVDFGSSGDPKSAPVAITPAYSPPELLEGGNPARKSMHSSQDMWALGIILYVMLTGMHPYDTTGNATDDEIYESVVAGKPPPLTDCPETEHLSDSAKDLILKLMTPKVNERLSALEMLEHPWVKGETASKDLMEGSHKRLSTYRVYQSRLEATVFKNFLDIDDMDNDDTTKHRTSLIEKSFRNLDPSNKGFLSKKDLRRFSNTTEGHHDGGEKLSLAGFSDLLSENMKNKHFPNDHIVYKEGEVGNHMYFINSGSVEVTTKEGLKDKRSTGDFFGEGALLHPKKIRSATIKCTTPVHAIEISREYFEKYMKESDDVKITLTEKDRSRKRSRAKMILRLQNNLEERIVKRGDVLFAEGEVGDKLFIVEEGQVDVSVKGRTVFKANPGDVTGEHSLVLGKPRNTTAVCASEECKVLLMPARDFHAFIKSTEDDVGDSIKDICLRRELKKSVVFKTRQPFRTDSRGLKAAFKHIDRKGKGNITLDDIRILVGEMDPTLTESDYKDILQALNVSGSGKVTLGEFEKVYREQQGRGDTISA